MRSVLPRLCLCFLCLCLLLLSAACGQKTVEQEFSYTDSAFTVSLRGELCLSFLEGQAPRDKNSHALGKLRAGEPLPFAAEVSATPVPSGVVHGGSADGGQILSRPAWRVKITYTAPEVLYSLSVSCIYSHPDGETPETLEDITVTYPSPVGTLSVAFTEDSIQGLILPALLLLPYGQITSVSPVSDDCRTVERAQSGLCLTNGTLTYRFSTDASTTAGYPLTVTWTGDGRKGHMAING